MKALILDGFHRGEITLLQSPLPVLRLIKPPSTTACGCSDTTEFVKSGEEILEYKLAAKGSDLWLYSRDGDLFGPMTSGRDWICADPLAPKRQELYYDCRDPRAF